MIVVAFFVYLLCNYIAFTHSLCIMLDKEEYY